MALKTYGTMGVDWEQRVDYDRLRRERLARIKELLARSSMGALLCFDMNNVRYITSTHIGTWAQDKNSRFTLLPQKDEPILWDFGSAARHHQLHCPWLGERSRAGIPSMRGAMTPEMGRAEDVAKKIRIELEKRGLHKEPLGVDIIEPDVMIALQREGISIVNGHALMCEAREIKTEDEITLLNMAAAMGDGVYQDIFEALKPGVRESEIVGMATKRLYEMGSDCVEAINAIAGERCSPHPHNFTDRLIRPGDQAYFDIIQSYMGYRTCYYRTFTVGSATPAQFDAYKKARRWMDDAIAMLKPGVSTDDVARAFPKSTEIGFETEMSAFGLNFCHGLGLGLHERPLISRVNSFKDPYELKAGMVFAVETFCPAKDGVSAARIEEEVVLTPDGAKVITLFPAQELPIANKY